MIAKVYIASTGMFSPYVTEISSHIVILREINYAGIIIQAYGPIGSPGRPKEHVADNEPVVLDDPIIKEIAQKHNATPAQV